MPNELHDHIKTGDKYRDECIEKVIGNLDKPDTGIIFTMPVDFVKGLNR